MLYGESIDSNPPFVTVTGGIGRYLVVVMVWESRDEEYRIDQVLERRDGLELARDAAIKCAAHRKMEYR